MDIKSKLLELFVEYALPLLATYLAAGLAVVLKRGGDYLGSKNDQSKLFAGLAQLSYLAQLAVAEVEAGTRAKLKAASADGHLSAVEKTELKLEASQILVRLAKEHAFHEAQKLLETMAPAATQFVSGLIERAVGAQKVERIVATLPSPVGGAAAVVP